MAGLVQRDRSHDRDLVLRSPSCLAARSFSAEIGVIQLDLSLQDVGLLPLSHGPEDLVVQQPGGVVVHPQTAAQLKGRDAGLGLADQVEGQKPLGQRQLGRLHDRAGCDGGLIPTGAALIPLEPAAMHKPMALAVAAGTVEPIRPACLLQGGLALLLSAVKPQEPRQRETLLELDAVARHGRPGICVPL